MLVPSDIRYSADPLAVSAASGPGGESTKRWAGDAQRTWTKFTTQPKKLRPGPPSQMEGKKKGILDNDCYSLLDFGDTFNEDDLVGCCRMPLPAEQRRLIDTSCLAAFILWPTNTLATRCSALLAPAIRARRQRAYHATIAKTSEWDACFAIESTTCPIPRRPDRRQLLQTKSPATTGGCTRQGPQIRLCQIAPRSCFRPSRATADQRCR